jgi:hypothetical protein
MSSDKLYLSYIVESAPVGHYMRLPDLCSAFKLDLKFTVRIVPIAVVKQVCCVCLVDTFFITANTR